MGDIQAERIELHHWGIHLSIHGDLGEAYDYLEQTLVFARRLSDSLAEAIAFRELGNVAHLLGKAEAYGWIEESLALFSQLNDDLGQGACHYLLAKIDTRNNDYKRAIANYQSALGYFSLKVEPITQEIQDELQQVLAYNIQAI